MLTFGALIVIIIIIYIVASYRKVFPERIFFMSTIISGGLYRLLTERFGVVGVPALLWLIPPIILCAAGGYLLGSLNSAVIISRALFSDDVRRHGSGNAGMTNMFRTYGKKAGILTLCGDILKTVISTLLGYLWLGYIGAYLAGLFCMLGHMFPVFYKFRGGKGVLVAAVMILMTEPLVFLVLIAVFAIVLLGTRMVSMASGMAALLYPLILSGSYTVLYGDGNIAGMRIPIAVFITVMILVMHRENFKRIYDGKEPKVHFPWNHDDPAADDDANDDARLSAADDGGDASTGNARKRTVKKKSTYGKKKK